MVAHQTVPDERLLRAVVEQIKLPLLQIAHQSETASVSKVGQLTSIAETARTALQLLDSYLLSTDLHAQTTLQFEPVSISSVLYDVAQQLTERARQYDCDVEVHLGSSYEPVIANRQAMVSAFFSLGCALIEGQQQNEVRRLIFSARKSKAGIIAGAYSQQIKISADAFLRGKALYGSSRQPLTTTASSASAGIFVADALLSLTASPLRVVHYKKLNGLATTLLPSQQLQLV